MFRVAETAGPLLYRSNLGVHALGYRSKNVAHDVLAKVTAPYGGRYDPQVGDPAKNLLASHQECLDIAYAAGVDVHPGHIKAEAAANFGKGPEIVELIEAGIERGQNVTVDLYPYDRAATAPVVLLLYPGDDDRGAALKQRLAGMMAAGAAEGDSLEQLTADLRGYWQDVSEQPEILAQAKTATEEPPEGLYSWVDVVVINNQWLGMVRQWQDMIYEGHRSGSDLADPMAVKAAGDRDIYPDFPMLAAGYRVRAERVSEPDQLAAAFECMLANPEEPYLLDVIVAAEENVYPMIPAGGSYRDIIMSAADMPAGARERQGSNV